MSGEREGGRGYSVFPPGLKRRGVSTLKLFMPGHMYIASLYYYLVLREHEKKGVAAPLTPFLG